MIPAWPQSHSSTSGVNPVWYKYTSHPEPSFIPVFQASTQCDISDSTLIPVSFQYSRCQPRVIINGCHPYHGEPVSFQYSRFQPRVILVILPWSHSHSSTQVLTQYDIHVHTSKWSQIDPDLIPALQVSTQCDIGHTFLIPVSFQYSRCQPSVI